MASISITGRLTANPEHRPGNGEKKSWLTASIAENNRERVDGKWQDQPAAYWNIKVFGVLADNAATSLSKGDMVTVTGSTKTRQFTPKGADKPVTVTEIIADDIAASLRWATVTIARTTGATIPDYDETDVPESGWAHDDPAWQNS